MSSWVGDFTEEHNAYFASFSNGWSSDELGLQWLERVFHRHTKDKAGNRRRLLIVDGHSSHVNMKFIMWVDKHRIIIAIIPLHSTHQLQLLDMGFFQPLATAYSKEITKLMSEGYGLVCMTKRIFWSVSAFAKTGIFPYDPSVILDKITYPEPVLELIIQEKTPVACASIRRIHKAY